MGTLGARQKSWDLLGCKLSVLKCMLLPPRCSSSLPASLYIVLCLFVYYVCVLRLLKLLRYRFWVKNHGWLFRFSVLLHYWFSLKSSPPATVGDERWLLCFRYSWTYLDYLDYVLHYGELLSDLYFYLSLSLSVLVLRLTSGCLEVLCGSIDPGEKIIIYKLE